MVHYSFEEHNFWTSCKKVWNFAYFKTTILDKMDEKLRPPLPPFQWWKKWHVFVVARVHHWIGGKGASIYHFILSKIVAQNLSHWFFKSFGSNCDSPLIIKCENFIMGYMVSFEWSWIKDWLSYNLPGKLNCTCLLFKCALMCITCKKAKVTM